MWMFEKGYEQEIMYIVMQMETVISVPDEDVIVQGDSSDNLFIIIKGKVSVVLEETNIFNPDKKAIY